MDIVPVNCNHCGASLEVPQNARFVTCRYCQSQLEIKRTESTLTTEVLTRIDQTTTAMAEDLRAIRHESEIERLDREWTARQAQLISRNKDGTVSRPSAAAGIIAAVVMGGFGIFWTLMAFKITAVNAHPPFPSGPGVPVELGSGVAQNSSPFGIASCIFPLFGVLFVVMAIAMGIKTALKAGKYDDEERRYRAQREELLRRQGAGDSAR